MDGGAARDAFLCQFQADILGIPIVRSETIETTSLGATLSAGLAVGVWPDRDVVRALSTSLTRFLPEKQARDRSHRLSGRRCVVDRARGWTTSH